MVELAATIFVVLSAVFGAFILFAIIGLVVEAGDRRKAEEHAYWLRRNHPDVYYGDKR